MQSTKIKIKINNSENLIYSVYKPPSATLHLRHLDHLSNNANRVIATGDLIAKYPLWYNHTSYTAGNIQLNNLSQNEYRILTPDSPIHFPTSPRH